MELSSAASSHNNGAHECGAVSRKRLRVLCLHGFRTSAAILKQQLFNKWDNCFLHDLLDLTFVDAPFPCKGKSEVDGIFPPPFFEWFQYNIIRSKDCCRASTNCRKKLNQNRSKIFTEYTGLEECIQYISNYMYQHGPFDGLLGFSQGAVLSAALAGLQQKGLALSGHLPLRFVLIISGAMFKNPKVKEDCYSDIIRCPSLHFIGANDWLKPKNEELRQVFDRPIIVRHGAKHTVPRLDEEAIAVLRSFLRRVQDCDKIVECRETKHEGIPQEYHSEERDKPIEHRGAEHEGILQGDSLSQIDVAA